jgi:two-component system sensor histidine kinase/response regulator
VLAFAVSDSGIGVSAKARERLFEAFAQGDSSTTRRFGGTGLGLSISRRLVELMGGRIWLGEHEGPGSTFCFTARVRRSADALNPVTPRANGLRILVLDGEATTRQTFEATIATWGMHAASSGDIDAARILLREAAGNGTPFQVVLITDVLPRSNGFAFAAELGDKPEYGEPARIFVSLREPIDYSGLYNELQAIEQEGKTSRADTSAAAGHVRILMAEDSALIRRVTRFQLEDLHYGVDIVENGAQAVAAVATGDYDLALMDMRMPEMDGLTATRAIRLSERENGRHIVVIALTANVQEGDREACIAAGMDDFLTKPLQLDALRSALERWLPEHV